MVTMAGPWTRIVFEFSGFPKCISGIVGEYCSTLKLLEWIDPACLTRELCANPAAVDAGMVDVRYAGHEMSANPRAADYIKAHLGDEFGCYAACWSNPGLFDWMMIHGYGHDEEDDDELKLDCMAENPNPDAIKYILEHVGIEGISRSNPSITLCGSWAEILSSPIKEYEDSDTIYANPSAMDMWSDADLIGKGEYLSKNPHPRAIEYLRNHQDEIDWVHFSANPGIFEYRADPRLIDIMSA